MKRNNAEKMGWYLNSHVAPKRIKVHGHSNMKDIGGILKVC